MVICAGCNRHIFDQYLLSVLDQSWHAACVQCSDCGIGLSDKCFSRDGKLYCRHDFFRRFGTKCAGCSEGISPNDLVRKALNKVFHLGCFTCMVCRKQLITGEEMVVLAEGKFVCKQDYVSSCRAGLMRPEFLQHPLFSGHVKVGRARPDGAADDAFERCGMPKAAGVDTAVAASAASAGAARVPGSSSTSPKEEMLSNNNNSASSVGVPSPNSSEPCDGLDELGGGGGRGGGGGVCNGVGGVGSMVVGISAPGGVYKESDLDLNLDDLVVDPKGAAASGDEDDEEEEEEAASGDESTHGSMDVGRRRRLHRHQRRLSRRQLG